MIVYKCNCCSKVFEKTKKASYLDIVRCADGAWDDMDICPECSKVIEDVMDVLKSGNGTIITSPGKEPARETEASEK